MARFSMSPKIRVHHHHLAAGVLACEEKGVKLLTATIKSFTNPFSDADTTNTNLFNLETKVVMPERLKKDLCEQCKMGSQLLDSLVKERIQSGKENLWLPMKKWKLLTWKNSSKILKVKAADKVVELQEDRSLFALMMIVYKS